MELFVDYHYHPNFNFRFRTAKRVEKIVCALERAKLDAVVVTEHVYKAPAKTYRLLEKHVQSSGQPVVLLPGVESLTKEGIDIVIFSYNEDFYEDPILEKVMKPFGASLEELLDIVSSHEDIDGYIPHPFTAGTTGVVEKLGDREAANITSSFGAVEVSNNAFSDVVGLVEKTPLAIVFSDFFRQIQRVQKLEHDFVDQETLRFLAIGSDAHFVTEIGYGCKIQHPDIDITKRSVFEALTSNKNFHPHCEATRNGLRMVWDTVKSMRVTFHEYLQKKAIKLSREHRKSVKLSREQRNS